MQMAKRQGRRKRGVAAWEWVRVRRAEVTASQACLPRIADWGDTFPSEIEGLKKEPQMEGAGEKATYL